MPDYENLSIITRLIGDKFKLDNMKPKSLVQEGDEPLDEYDHDSLRALKRRDLWGDEY